MQFVCRWISLHGKRIVMYVAAGLVPGLLCILLTYPALAQDTSDSAQSGESDIGLRGVVIPTGFQAEKYSAMVQVALDGSPLPDATWDITASFTSQGEKAREFSGRVEAGDPGTPVVFEFQVEFEPGPFELKLTARETTAGQSGTHRVVGTWPDPEMQRATISPVILLQPAQGAFVRGENARGQGALAVVDEYDARPDLPTAAVSVVCRRTALAVPVRIERRLEGASQTKFETIELLPDHDQCAQVRDMIAPGTLAVGRFRYEVHLLTDSGEIDARVHEFETAGSLPES